MITPQQQCKMMITITVSTHQKSYTHAHRHNLVHDLLKHRLIIFSCERNTPPLSAINELSAEEAGGCCMKV